ncbi:MAG: hypothetical protein ACRELV_07165 [Longimicrobiales bacterium]
MLTTALRLVLLSFALVAFAGAGASLAVIRFRRISEGDVDWGMTGVTLLLVCFGGLCTALGAGWAGVPAFGGVVAWVSYVFMARHIGLFEVDAGASAGPLLPTEEHRSSKQ